MKIKNIILLSACILSLVSGGCSRKSQEPKLKSVSIAFQSWIGYGPLYLADELGFFKDEGIEVIFVDEQLDSARRDAFKAGILDCEAGTLDLLINKRAQGIPIVSVFDIDLSFGADAIVATSQIKELKDLIGKRVAFAMGNVSDTFISCVFSKEGLRMEDINIVAINPDKAADVFLAGQVDAVVTWEPLVSKALERPGAHILLSSKDRPGIIVDTFNIREDIIKNDPGLVKGIMRAWFRAFKFCEENPSEANRIISRHFNISPDEFKKEALGLKWIDYKDQISDVECEKRCEVFDLIAQIKLERKTIISKPDAESGTNRKLIKELYENSQ